MKETATVSVKKRNYSYVGVGRVFVIILMNLCLYPFLAIWTILGGIIFLPALLIWSLVTRWPIVKIMHKFIWIYAWVCNAGVRCFVKVDLVNFDKNHFTRPGIIVLNHYSFFDTYLLSYLPIFEVHIGLRAWPFKMPWYALFMRMAGYLNLEDTHWEKILARVRELLSQEKHFVMFPEGHRSRTGKMRRFHSGAFKLAMDCDVPVIPMCLTGTQDLLPPGRFWFEPARISIQILDPIFPDAFQGENAHVELRKHVRQLMVETVDQMENQLK